MKKKNHNYFSSNMSPITVFNVFIPTTNCFVKLENNNTD